jgi:hypothetical protein
MLIHPSNAFIICDSCGAQQEIRRGFYPTDWAVITDRHESKGLDKHFCPKCFCLFPGFPGCPK